MKKTNALFSALALALAAGLLASCGGGDERVLNVYNWTYYTPDDVVDAFEQEFNCTVNIDLYASNEEMYAKLRGGARGYDIVVPSQDYCSIMIKQGMLQPLDQSKMTNKSHINPRIVEMMADFDPDMTYCMPYYLGAAGVSVNKTKVPFTDYDRTWNIFADERFAGHASMMDDMREVLGDALAYLGYSVNSLDDAELRAAADLVINDWRPNLAKFDAEGFGKSFASGDLWVCQGYAEVTYGEVSEDKWDETIEFFIPQDGGPAYLDSMAILADAEHVELANEFINYMHRPENYAKFLDFFHFPAFVNMDAEEYMTTTPMYEASQMENCTLKNDIGEGLDKFNNLWQEIRYEE